MQSLTQRTALLLLPVPGHSAPPLWLTAVPVVPKPHLLTQQLSPSKPYNLPPCPSLAVSPLAAHCVRAADPLPHLANTPATHRSQGPRRAGLYDVTLLQGLPLRFLTVPDVDQLQHTRIFKRIMEMCIMGQGGVYARIS